MSNATVLFVLLSAFAHALWNALLKRNPEPERGMAGMMTISSIAAVAILLVTRSPLPPLGALFWVVVSGLLEAVYFVTLARALDRAPLGTVYTIVRGGALVAVWPVSVLLFGERVTTTAACGGVLVLLGLAATGVGQHATSAAALATDRARVTSGLAIAAFCALFVGGYHLAYKAALARGGAPLSVNALSLATGSAINLARLGRGPRGARSALSAIAANPFTTTLGGLLGCVGFALFLTAMQDAGAGVVLTLRNTSILFAQVFGLALGERPHRLGILGAALVVTGAVLLSL